MVPEMCVQRGFGLYGQVIEILSDIYAICLCCHWLTKLWTLHTFTYNLYLPLSAVEGSVLDDPIDQIPDKQQLIQQQHKNQINQFILLFHAVDGLVLTAKGTCLLISESHVWCCWNQHQCFGEMQVLLRQYWILPLLFGANLGRRNFKINLNSFAEDPVSSFPQSMNFLYDCVGSDLFHHLFSIFPQVIVLLLLPLH